MVERRIAAGEGRTRPGSDAPCAARLFLPAAIRELAYEDSPLPITGEQTISQPDMVAFMAEALALKGGEKVLEIGAPARAAAE